LVARGLIELSEPEPLAQAGALPEPESRMVYQDGETGWLETPVYAGAGLGPGHRLQGPLLIEEPTTTVVVGPDDSLEVDDFGNFAITLGARP
jgi:N-methylhydantoinase A